MEQNCKKEPRPVTLHEAVGFSSDEYIDWLMSQEDNSTEKKNMETVSELLRKAVFMDFYDSKADGTRTLYFNAPKDLVTDQYPEADGADISIEFPLNEQEAHAACAMIGPIKRHADGDEETYDWSEMNLPYEDIERLMQIAAKPLRKAEELRNEYHKYQLRWMADHGYSIQDLIDELDELQEDCDSHDCISDIFEMWEKDYGFGSEIWSCQSEWESCEAPGHDKGDAPAVTELMTVKQLRDSLISVGTRIVLKDAFNGREYTRVEKYEDRKVTSMFSRIDVSADKRFAQPTLVLWIEHIDD